MDEHTRNQLENWLLKKDGFILTGYVLEGFKEHLQACGVSERTQKKYIETVKLFGKRAQVILAAASESEVKAYMCAQRERKIGAQTWRGYRFALQSFYRDYLGKDWRLFDLPLHGPRRSKTGLAIPGAVFRRVWVRIHNPRHAAAIGLCWSCGLRISEACGLAASDLDPSGFLRVIGKGEVERRVPVPERALAHIKSVWATHGDPRWLLPNAEKTAPVHPDVVSKSWRLARQDAGVTYPYGTHSLRHAYASRLYAAGVGEEVIRQMLGHAHVDTTRGYITIGDAAAEQIKEIAGRR